MSLKKERIELENYLKFVIDKYGIQRKVIKEIKGFLGNDKARDTLDNIIIGKNTLSSLSIPMLCVITCAVYEVTEYEDIDPREFFTNAEIKEYNNVDFENYSEENKHLTLPIILDNVTMVDEENYFMPTTAKFLVEWMQNNLLQYDYNSQRSAIYLTGKNGDAIAVQDLNMQSVVDIADNMKNGTYLPDTLSINVYSDDVEPLTYDPKKRKMEIHEGASITILDGFHRLRGSERALYDIPDLNQPLFLTIRSYDEETAKRYFGQINTVNVVAPERLRELKSERYSDLAVKDLQRKSELKEKIASAPSISKVAKQLTTFDLLSYAIDRTFNPKSRLEAKEVAAYLGDVFDYLIGSYYDEFVEKMNKHRNSYSHPLMFVGYITIGKIMYDKNIKPNKIKDIVSKIDFEDEDLQSILKNPRGINNKRNRNKILDYFRVRGDLIVQ